MTGKEVEVGGWVHDVRILGGISFVLLRNSKGIIQITLKKGSAPDLMHVIEKLKQEDVIKCRGVVTANKAARNSFEIFPSRIDVISKSRYAPTFRPQGFNTGTS